MKRVILTMLLLVFVGNLIQSCRKEQTLHQRVFTEEEMVWVTPTGYVIPATERHNWEKFISQNVKEKAAKGYESSACTTETISCGLKCTGSKTDNCSKESACAPCMNCGCTPIASPYK